MLRIGYSYNGPTEIGGLVLQPEYRRAERLGTFISYVRFLYLAAHRDLFQDEVLAELLPPLEPDGTSHLWEALGRHFTGHELRRGRQALEEEQGVHQRPLPRGRHLRDACCRRTRRTSSAKTGSQTRGVEKLLRRIGFRYAHRVDPFDGGPHFTARMDEIRLVADTRRTRADRPISPMPADKKALIAIELPEAPFFRAVLGSFRDEGPRGVVVDNEAWEILALHHSSPVIVLPIE